MKNTIASASSSNRSALTQEAIAHRAREIWLSRGSPEGQDVEIWLLAERELNHPIAAPAPSKSAGKPSRKARAGVAAKNSAGSETIDVGELQERLTQFGESLQRSPTSLDLS